MEAFNLPPQLLNDTTATWLAVVILLFSVALTRLLFARFIRRMIRGKFIGPHIGRRMQAATRVFAWIVFALLALQATGIVHQAWAILSATVAALAVGFVAYWSILSNVTAAVFILSFRPFRIGDTISVWDGAEEVLRGEVIDLNLMFVSTTGPEMTIQRLPNNIIFQRTVRVHRASDERPSLAEDRVKPFFDTPPNTDLSSESARHQG